jgi:hypothetical protein
LTCAGLRPVAVAADLGGRGLDAGGQVGLQPASVITLAERSGATGSPLSKAGPGFIILGGPIGGRRSGAAPLVEAADEREIKARLGGDP